MKNVFRKIIFVSIGNNWIVKSGFYWCLVTNKSAQWQQHESCFG